MLARLCKDSGFDLSQLLGVAMAGAKPAGVALPEPVKQLMIDTFSKVAIYTYDTALPHIFALIIIVLGMNRVIPGLINYYGFEYFDFKRPYMPSLLRCWFGVVLISIMLKSISWQFIPWSMPPLALMLVSLYGVVALDRRFHIIPDRLQIMGLFGALGFLISLHYGPQQLAAGAMAVHAAAGIALPVAILICNVIYSNWRRRQAMGLGDVKLLTWLGLALGPTVYVIIAYAMLFALVSSGILYVCRQRQLSTSFAFGPYIVAGYIVTCIIPNWQQNTIAFSRITALFLK